MFEISEEQIKESLKICTLETEIRELEHKIASTTINLQSEEGADYAEKRMHEKGEICLATGKVVERKDHSEKIKKYKGELTELKLLYQKLLEQEKEVFPNLYEYRHQVQVDKSHRITKEG